METKCSRCSVSFEPVDWQIKKREWICISCRRYKQKEWRRRRKDFGNPVISTRMPKDYHERYNNEYYAREDIKAKRAGLARIRRGNPDFHERIDARAQVYNAIRRKDLIKKPCEVCGKVRVDAHHDDYSKPLEVRWLCREHHIQLHLMKKD